jgi:3',5'-cyclic AMP phosphodiesterase CpdA
MGKKQMENPHAGLIDELPIFAQIIDTLREGRSVLFSMPRYCNAREILYRVQEVFGDEIGARCILLEAHILPGKGTVDYQELWEVVRGAFALRSPKQLQPNDCVSFERALKAALHNDDKPTLFLLPGLGRNREKHFHEMLKVFHQIVLRYKHARVAASDDFAFWFYARYIPDYHVDSALYLFRPLTSTGLSEQQVSAFLSKVGPSSLSEVTDPSLSRRVYDLTGGHIGLVLTLCRHLASQGWVVPDGYFTGDGERLLAQSVVLEGIRRDIQEDVIGITTTALEFREPSCAVEYASPRYQLLRQLGILDIVNPSEMKLTTGVIGRFIEDTANAHVPNRLGTVVSPTGITRFESRELMIEDSDIVALHLSDLHIGRDHAFGISYRGGILNEGIAPLADLLRQDLIRLNLLGRVDALILSGDLVCTGSHDEFLRAVDVIIDIGRKCELKLSEIMIIPGNHDIQWEPSDLAATVARNRSVSRESFETFLRLLDNRTFEFCEDMRVEARNGKTTLHIVGFDSNYVEGREAAGIGYIAREGLEKGGKYIDSLGEGRPETNGIWLVVHHHVFPVTSADLQKARERNVSVMGNASELLRYAYQWGVELILHGHEHQPVVTWAQRWMGETASLGFRPLAVLGAGSCGAKRELLGPMARNQFYVIVRKESEIIVRSRVLGEEGVNFVPHQDFSISISGESLGKGRRTLNGV